MNSVATTLAASLLLAVPALADAIPSSTHLAEEANPTQIDVAAGSQATETANVKEHFAGGLFGPNSYYQGTSDYYYYEEPYYQYQQGYTGYPFTYPVGYPAGYPAYQPQPVQPGQPVQPAPPVGQQPPPPPPPQPTQPGQPGQPAPPAPPVQQPQYGYPYYAGYPGYPVYAPPPGYGAPSAAPPHPVQNETKATTTVAKSAETTSSA